MLAKFLLLSVAVSLTSANPVANPSADTCFGLLSEAILCMLNVEMPIPFNRFSCPTFHQSYNCMNPVLNAGCGAGLGADPATIMTIYKSILLQVYPDSGGCGVNIAQNSFNASRCSIRQEAKNSLTVSACLGVTIGMNVYSSDCHTLTEGVNKCIRPILSCHTPGSASYRVVDLETFSMMVTLMASFKNPSGQTYQYDACPEFTARGLTPPAVRTISIQGSNAADFVSDPNVSYFEQDWSLLYEAIRDGTYPRSSMPVSPEFLIYLFRQSRSQELATD